MTETDYTSFRELYWDGSLVEVQPRRRLVERWENVY